MLIPKFSVSGSKNSGTSSLRRKDTLAIFSNHLYVKFVIIIHLASSKTSTWKKRYTGHSHN